MSVIAPPYDKQALAIELDNLIFDPPEIGCVLYMSGLPGGGSTIHDKGIYGYHGTMVGPTWTRLSSGLWCLDFPGSNDYVELASSSQLNFTTGDFSGTAWAYFDTLGTWNVLFNRGNWNADGWCFQAHTTGYLSCWTSQALAGQNTLSSAGDVTTGTWYHLGFSRTGAAVKLYKNGVDVTATPATHIDPKTCSRTMKIGISDDKSLNEVDGKIALFRVFNRQMVALDFQKCFNREKSLFGVW